MSQTQSNNITTSQGSFNSYTLGFILSIILTVIPFTLVMTSVLPHDATLFCIVSFAIIQIFIHLHYFLHLNTSAEMHWNVLSLLFTIFIMVLFIGGTIWIMYSLHYRM